MKRFARFFENLQQDFKIFAYWCLVLLFFRMIFIYVYSSQLDGDFSEVLKALWLGLRLSLKTAGIISLLGFVLATLPNIIWQKWPVITVKSIYHQLVGYVFAFLFMARIPYYKIYNSGFNMMLINGFHDDWQAVFHTAVQEYQLLPRLVGVLLLGYVLQKIVKPILRSRTISFASLRYRKIVMAGTLLSIPIIWVFVRYGGAFSYENSINWESAARLRSNMLNEAILDDGQALYRVYCNKRMLDKVHNVNISKAELQRRIANAGGNPQAPTVEEAFLHTVAAPKLAHKPQNIVLILGESFGQWPFLEPYTKLGLVEKMRALQAQENCASINTMLPNASGTIGAVNGLVTGFPSSNLYLNYQPNSFKDKYAMGIGYIMQKLGYKTVFWYGGFPGWQNVQTFVLAQSFDEFHAADEFNYQGGNAWGCPDELLFYKVNDYIQKEQSEEKVFHLILTTSNHPPYSIDVDSVGFPREEVRKKLPKAIDATEQNLTELGHIWYADKTMGDFIAKVEKHNPDTLFVVTGDHSERFTFAIEQDIRTCSAIPCIFYGQGVRKDWFNKNAVGCHMQLAGTLAEMVGPSGFTYSAFDKSMFVQDKFVFNHKLAVFDGNIYTIKSLDTKERGKTNDMRSIASWRALKGNEIE